MEQYDSPTMPAKTEDAYARMLRRSREEHSLKKNIFATMMRAANSNRLEATVLDSHLKRDQCLKVMWNLDCVSDHDGSLGPKRINDAQTDSAPVDDVFGIPELAEKILLECRIRDLLTNCQRVCKQWQCTIVSSKRLQQALFFEPLGGYDITYFWCDARDTSAQDDPHFADEDQTRRVEWSGDGDEVHTADEERRYAEGERTLVFANPLLDKKGNRRLNIQGLTPASYAMEAAEDYEWRQKAMQHPTASWRHMLACQPPLSEIEFDVVHPDDTNGSAWFNRSPGLLMGEIVCYDETKAAIPVAFTKMIPVTYARDVVRINYKKGEYEFKEFDFKWDDENQRMLGMPMAPEST